MHSLSLFALLLFSLRVNASPLPDSPLLEVRHNNQCKRDGLYNIMHDRKYGGQPSAYCSSFIARTQTRTVTATPTVRVTARTTHVDSTAYKTVTRPVEVTLTTPSVYTVTMSVEETITETVKQYLTITSDFTTTDYTYQATLTDEETVTITDATVYITDVAVQDFTTVDASKHQALLRRPVAPNSTVVCFMLTGGHLQLLS